MVSERAPKAVGEANVPLFGTTRVAHAINLHKALVGPLVLGFMWHFDNWGQPALLYCLIHALYASAWLVKHANFRDKAFDASIPFWQFLALFFYVNLYYIAPFCLTRYRKDKFLSNQELALVLTLWAVGCGLHFFSDAQKYWTLKWRGRGLITTGFFSLTRNPNYLGEILIYSAYVILSRSYAAVAVLLYFTLSTFLPNMWKKDKSLEKYEDFAAYKARTWLLVPYLF